MQSINKPNTLLKGLTYTSAALVLATLYMSLVYAPTEVTMGEVQRIFYIHVASNWVGMFLAFGVSLVTGIIYLRTRSLKWDRIALSSVEIGVVFTTIGTATGSIWGRPAWNTWWTWDPRLTTATVMILLYVAYMMLREAIDDPERRARFAAVYGIVSFISVPLTFFSIRIWRTIHPVVIGGGDPNAQGSMDMTSQMVVTLIFAVLAFTVLYITLLWHRVRLELLKEKVAQLKASLFSAEYA